MKPGEDMEEPRNDGMHLEDQGEGGTVRGVPALRKAPMTAFEERSSQQLEGCHQVCIRHRTIPTINPAGFSSFKPCPRTSVRHVWKSRASATAASNASRLTALAARLERLRDGVPHSLPALVEHHHALLPGGIQLPEGGPQVQLPSRSRRQRKSLDRCRYIMLPAVIGRT